MNNTTDLGTWWASLALVNAGLAQSNGRSRRYWFLFSRFLGPLATLFIVVWPPGAPHRDEEGHRHKHQHDGRNRGLTRSRRAGGQTTGNDEGAVSDARQ
jgi:hypothetical protein